MQILFYINTFIWFCLATYIAIVMFKDNNGWSTLLVGFFLYVNAAAMLLSGIFLGRRETWAYYFALVVLITNALVTRATPFDLFDLFALIYDLVIIGVLVWFRRPYLNRA
jgi:hypothetical protein